MPFYLSPLVDVQEIDLTTTIPAVATSIGVEILRNTYKGPEMKTTFIANEDELIRKFGMPTSNRYCFEDVLNASGFLKYGRNFYCTRVMPLSATFAGIQVNPVSGAPASGAAPSASGFSTYDTPFTLQDIGNRDDPYFGDPDEFGDETVNNSADMWMIASSRGEWGNKIRVAFVNKTTYDRLNSTPLSAVYDEPWYPYDEFDNVKPEWQGLEDQATFFDVMKIDTPPIEDTDFLIIVQDIAQGEKTYETREVFLVSTDPMATDGEGQTRYCETVINMSSQYIRISLNEVLIDQPWMVTTPVWEEFKQGSNGKDYVTGLDMTDTSNVDPAIQMQALDLYANAEDIDVNLFIDSDKQTEIKKYMIDICEKRKDSMAILDCKKEHVVNNRGNEVMDLTEWRKGIASYMLDNLNENTSYAALYGNWCEVYDKYNRKYRWIPMAGHVAGIYAKTDYMRDPWWAPAGLNRAILTNIRRLAWNPKLGHRDMLYKDGINPIVSFAGQGKVVWGQKTMLDKSSAFNRVNVRRLFIVLEKAISTAAKYFLFEFNDRITRSQLVTMIEPFLRDVQQRRGIYDFKVVCDETNNTPERIDRNELWCTIFIKPTRVAEFIVLQFVAMKTGMTFEEAAQEVINYQG
jgi:hypothetical protein